MPREGNFPTMFRTIAPQQTLWASVLPEVARGLPPRLAELDSYFEDPRLFEPFRQRRLDELQTVLADLEIEES